MNDWIGLGIIILIACGGFYALVRANEPRRPLTEEEFQKRVQESSSFVSAGVGALQKLLDAPAERAKEVAQDLKHGHYQGEQESGDGNDTAPVEENTPEDGEEKRDA